MRFNQLADLESRILRTGNNGEYSFRKFTIPIPGENGNLEGLFVQPASRAGYFRQEAHPKQRIVLHYTTGNLSGDMGTLTQNNVRISVPFLIARDGTIYQLFSSRFWSGHIGKTPLNTNNAEDRATIGIELSNYGFLKPFGNNLETYYSRAKQNDGRTGPVDIYCSLAETAAYQKIATPFRDQVFYATYTQAQYDSLIVLLRYLTAQYNIPRQFLPEPIRYHTTPQVLNFKGIVTHVNYRESGKWDIGPAFDWQRVISGVQAISFQPAGSRGLEVNISNGEQVLESETAMEPLVAAGADHQEVAVTEEDVLEFKAALEHPRKPRLQALVVGIDAYPRQVILEDQVSFRPLRGCVSDAIKMKDYLEQESDFEVQVQLLVNEQASKQAIITAFRNHLGQAGEGDVALFYFSGHGTQEYADTKLWRSDTDGKLECLACYYDEHSADQFLLADKELRFLIREVAGNSPHVVALFDCCHSGDNTRNGSFATGSFSEAVEKRIPFTFRQRPWADFVFSDEISYEQMLAQGEADLLPEGKHVQLAACESDESAMEVGGEGVFTKTVLQVLKNAGGNLTYQELRSRVRQYLRNSFEQKPKVYAASGAEDLLLRNFLNKPISGSTTLGEIVYNQTSSWQLNLGAVHGIDTQTLIMVAGENGTATLAKISEVRIDHSLVFIEGTLDANKAYKATVENLQAARLPLFVENLDGSLHEQEQVVNSLFERGKHYIVPEDNESAAKYVLRNRRGLFYVTNAIDPYRPLLAPVDTATEEAPLLLAATMKHVSQWNFLKDLRNKDQATTLAAGSIRVDLEQVEELSGNRPLQPENGLVEIRFGDSAEGWRTALRIRLTNTTDQNLYCCALYLTAEFQSYTGMLNPEVYLLTPGASVALNIEGDAVMPVKSNRVFEWYNWAYWQDHLKIIYSTEDFDGAAFSLDALPLPRVPDERGRGELKSIDFKKSTHPVALKGWSTQLITLRFHNPNFNRITEQNLARFLNDDELAGFALGIYFEPVPEGALDVDYRLRKEIEVLRPDLARLERGFVGDRIIDLANLVARSRRNRHFRKMLERFPHLPKIVSEGDSWFQHPLVPDVIDHLSRVYPIYCVAAAADTLRNYVSGQRRRGEYFLNAIEEQDPQFFLISGGGNDILGEQFRSYLIPYNNDGLPEGENPRRFLHSSLFEELAALKEIYRSVFGTLSVTKPALKILVHGYDYPVKLNSPDKGWLGRYMIEKGIRPGDRRAIIRLIMDAFNGMLQELAVAFPQVSYIDVRGLVHFNPENGTDQWYDEIHPNGDGFQQVAMKFLQKINELSGGVALSAQSLEKERAAAVKPDTPISRSGRVVEEVEMFLKEKDRGLTLDAATEPINRGAKVSPPTSLSSPPGKGAGSTNGNASGFQKGQMDYDIPGFMTVGELYKCRVKIADLDVAAAQVKFAGSDNHTQIRIAQEMSVCLLDASGGSHFEINAISSERQAILPGEVTSWWFNVIPKKQGTFPLMLRITIHEENRSRDLDILEKEVLVHTGKQEGTPTDNPRRILFLAANPYDTQPLRLGAESREIQEELAQVPDKKIVFTMNMAVTTRTLMRYILKERPDIVHFSGHSETEGLCLETEDGATKMVDEVTLAALFSQFDETIDCVVLNACYSAAQAKAIAKHIPFVVGMQKSIPDAAAMAFARGFYMALAAGENIPKAFELGLVSMRLDTPGQHTIPVLIERDKKPVRP